MITDKQAKAVGLRAVAAGFQLEPGCRVRRNTILYVVTWAEDGEVGIAATGPRVERVPASEVWPDFREPPSLGCLLWQVRGRLGRDATAVLHRYPGYSFDPPVGDEAEAWRVDYNDFMQFCDDADTEIEALVVALEAAPAPVQP